MVMFRWAVFVFVLRDTLTLKDGRVISGTYLGGTTTAIRFLSADRGETIPISDIQRVSFDPGASTSSSSVTTPAGGVAPSTLPEVANKQQHFCEAVDSLRNGNAPVVTSGHLLYVADQSRSPSHSDTSQRYRGTTDSPAASVAPRRSPAAFDRVELAQ
jgi:hypothetical protein